MATVAPSRPDEWVQATITVGEIARTRYSQSYDWQQLFALSQGLALTLARMNARTCASQTLRLYKAKASDQEAETTTPKRKTVRAMRDGRMGMKAAEYAEGAEPEEVLDHPAIRVLNRPNQWYTGRQMSEQAFVHRQIVGNSFWECVGAGEPVQLLPMIPWWVVVVPDPTDFIAGYFYDRSRAGGQYLPPSAVLHLKHSPSESDPFTGDGWFGNVRAEARMLATDAGFDIINAERGYQPPFAVQFDEPYNETKANQAMAFFKQYYAGWTKMTNPLLLWKGEYKPTQTTPKDLQSLEKIRQYRLAVALAAGVPESMLSLNDANLASASQGYSVQYLDATVRPMCNSEADQLTEMYLPKFGVMPGEMWFAYDDPCPANDEAKSVRMLAEVGQKVRTRNEYREEFSMEPIEGGDEFEKPVDPLAALRGGAGANPMDAPEDPEMEDPEDDPPEDEADTEAKYIHSPERFKAGWYGGHDHGEKAEFEQTDPGLERAIRAWYEREMLDAARTIANGGTAVQFDDAGLQAIFRQYLAGTLLSGAESGAAQVGLTTGVDGVNADIERFLSGYIPTLSAEIRNTTQERVVEIGQAVRASLLSTPNGSIEDVMREITRLVPEEAGYMAERIARTETALASSRGAMLAWERGNVEKKEWLLAPGGCPMCSALVAQRPVVGVSETFAKAGEVYGGSTVSRDSYGPPLHPNCRCALLPVIEGIE